MYRTGLILSILIILAVHFFYYPKWTKKHTEATISWDASGYYMYLPATFIYKDLKQCQFQNQILKKYRPTPDFQQAFLHKPSGNYVMKYSSGQALVFSPAFVIAHVWASYDSRYPADGFSLPYQFCLSMWTLIIATIGLLFLWTILRTYFSDKVSILGILAIILGTNYLNYSAIDGAMTHNTLFTIYSILIYLTIQFYKRPKYVTGMGIGLCVGIAALIRPTEIISCIIPILWGLKNVKWDSIVDRLQIFQSHWQKLAIAVLLVMMVGSIQLLYWKYVTGEFIVYSYEEQGFDWLSPHILEGILSYKSGWLIYSPIMILALLGFIPLYMQHRSLFFATIAFTGIFIYIAFAWSIWWYGGSLGQRTMVQAYPILAFPLCAIIHRLLNAHLLWKIISGGFIVLFIYANLWFTHQAHLGGLLPVGRVTKPYFWEILFKYEIDKQDLKLLDGVDQIYKGKPKNLLEVMRDTSSATLSSETKFTPKITAAASLLPTSYDWIRVESDVHFDKKEWNLWQMAQLIVEVKNGDQTVKRHSIRVHNQVEPNQVTNLFLDIRKPNNPFDRIETYFWKSSGNKIVNIKNTRVLTFDDN